VFGLGVDGVDDRRNVRAGALPPQDRDVSLRCGSDEPVA